MTNIYDKLKLKTNKEPSMLGISGGKAIASGGYGCVLRPPLKCQGDTKPQEGMISKLMMKNKAEEEMKEVNDAKRVLSKIPNYEKYFALTNYRMCIPAPMSQEDRINFNSECRGPLRAGFEKVNKDITKSSSSYRAIISPDLGIDVDKAFKSMFSNPSKSVKHKHHLMKELIRFNTTAADFLKNGISKMVEQEFYHSDVKGQNILTNYDPMKKDGSNFTEMKLIDYGLALPHKAFWRDTNTHKLFNFPFTSFFFDDYTLESINRKLRRAKEAERNGGDFNKHFEQEITNMIDDTFNRSWQDFTHIPYMLDLGTKMFNTTKDNYKKFLKMFYVIYCYQAILSFLDNSGPYPRFAIDKYWEDVYRYNLDVWGFLTVFLSLTSKSMKKQPEIANEYMVIINDYLYNGNYSDRPIPVDDIVNVLHTISNKFRGIIGEPVIPLQTTPVASPHRSSPSPKQATAKSASAVKVINVVKPKRRTKKLIVVDKFTAKPQLIIKPKSKTKSIKPNSDIISLNAQRKRCPKGYIKHKTIKNKCIKKTIRPVRPLLVQKAPTDVISLKSGRKRCPKGYRQHKTQKNKCVKI